MTIIAAGCLIALVAGIIHSGIGFGFGIVAIGLLPWVIDTRSSHVLVSTASLPVLIGAVWQYRHAFDRRELAESLFGAVIGMPVGLMAFEAMPMDWLVRGTGLAILLMLGLSVRNQRMKDPPPTRPGACFVAGLMSGVLAGSVSIAGPPIAAFALRQRWQQDRFKAFVNQFLLAVSVYKISGLAYRGFIDESILRQAIWLAPAALVGIVVGARLSQQLSNHTFRICVGSVLVAMATYFLLAGN